MTMCPGDGPEKMPDNLADAKTAFANHAAHVEKLQERGRAAEMEKAGSDAFRSFTESYGTPSGHKHRR